MNKITINSFSKPPKKTNFTDIPVGSVFVRNLSDLEDGYCWIRLDRGSLFVDSREKEQVLAQGIYNEENYPMTSFIVVDADIDLEINILS